MTSIIEYEGLNIIDIGEYKGNENEFTEAVHSAITKDGFFSNKLYPILINNQVIFAWYNTKGFLHWYLKREHMTADKQGHIKIIDTMFPNDYKRVIEKVKDDNIFLFNHGQFDNKEELAACQ